MTISSQEWSGRLYGDEHLERARHLLAARRLPEAFQAFHCAEQTGAEAGECRAGRWVVAMLRGDMEGAWQESDALRRMSGHDPHRFWDGMPLVGKRVIVRCLHGLGDTVQMMRYAPRLRELTSHVIYEVAPRMMPLASCFAGVDEVITWGDGSPLTSPVWDTQVEVMELPYLFRTNVADLPIAGPYLKVPEEQVVRAAARMGLRRRKRVGLVWTAGEWNVQRSLPPSLLESRFGMSSVEFWSLEHGGDRLAGVGEGVRDAWAVCGDGLLALGAVIANLDLVITVDTLAAHLAGAMGKPVWVMLQHAADWRWMAGREDSPWYPTMRLFRQADPGDWKSVVDAIGEALPHEG